MTVKDIYEKLLDAKRPSDFFGEVSSNYDLERLYNFYATKIDSGLNSNKDEFISKECFSLLDVLYNTGLAELEEGIYGVNDSVELYRHMTPLFEIAIEDEQFKFYENVYEGEIAYIFKGISESNNIVFLKVAIDPNDNDLIDNEYNVLSNLRHQSFPYAEHEIKVNDSNAIIMQEAKGISVFKLLKKYPRGIPAEHVMWMLERLLSAVGYLHSNFVVHGNIKPENIIINLTNHNVSLLGFSFCITNANTKEATYKIVNRFYTAPEVCKDASVLPSSDIYSIGKLAIRLLGGNIVTNIMPPSVDERIKTFIEKMVSISLDERPNDAWKLWSELIELRNEVFGTDRFEKIT